MTQLKNEFLSELETALKGHPDQKIILHEYEQHLDELFISLLHLNNESDLRDAVYKTFGTPEEIAGTWREELSITPSWMKWLFTLINVLFFIGGLLLTTAHHLLDWSFVSFIWTRLTSIPVLIALFYMVFWGLLGYEFGRSFGHKGRSLVKSTFIIALTPNLILMILVLTGIIPSDYFNPLLTNQFIFLCMVLTFLLYPVCLICYRWGKRASL